MLDRLANLDAIASPVQSRTEQGWRALDVRAWDGIDIRLLPDRGFDSFGAWYRGVPLHWVSALGESGPISGRLRDDGGHGHSAGGCSPPAACVTSARRARGTGCTASPTTVES